MSRVMRENNNVLVMGKQERSLEDTIICACSNTKLSITKFLEDVNDIKSKLFSTCNKCREKDFLRESKEERKIYKQELENKAHIKLNRYSK